MLRLEPGNAVLKGLILGERHNSFDIYFRITLFGRAGAKAFRHGCLRGYYEPDEAMIASPDITGVSQARPRSQSIGEDVVTAN